MAASESPSVESSNPATPPTPPAPAAPVKPASVKPTHEPLPQFRVLLHNDEVNDMGYVVDTLLALTPVSLEKAVEIMTEAHEEGVSLVLVTHRERAELYRDQLLSKRLTATIEPVA